MMDRTFSIHANVMTDIHQKRTGINKNVCVNYHKMEDNGEAFIITQTIGGATIIIGWVATKSVAMGVLGLTHALRTIGDGDNHFA